MTSKKSTGVLISSIIAIVISFTILIGSTFAWFTDSASSGINKIQSGNLDVGVNYTNSYNGMTEEITENTEIFTDINGDKILWEPGAFASGRFEVANNGSLALKYELSIVQANATQTPTGKTLADALTIYALMRNKNTGTDGVMGDSRLEALPIDSAIPEYDPQKSLTLKNGFKVEGYLLPQESITYEVGVYWEPSENDNEYNIPGGLSIDFMVALVATQVNYETDGDGSFYDENANFPKTPVIQTEWDGSADTSWYDENSTEVIISSPEALAGLSELVKAGNTFEGKTIKLISDIDLHGVDENENPISFRPIGDKSPFKGTFDGQGHTIENLYQSGWDFGYEWGSYGALGLFGELESATVKNLNVSGMNSQVEGGDISFIAGSATGTCVFENITIEDSSIGTYNNGCGGIIGWSGAGEYTFKNITLGEDVVLGGLWGSFDSSIGGIVGQGEPGATYNFENIDISCRLDVYNDVIAAYKYYCYRMSGMIIGRLAETTTIDGVNYPDMSQYNINCTNVNVNYGDWMNYHYCVVSGKTAWRVEPGYAYGGVPADHDHSTCAMHCNELMPFDTLFGGDQYGVRGIKEYAGVTVNYPASYTPGN